MCFISPASNRPPCGKIETHRPTLTACAQAVLQELLLDEDLKAHLWRLYPDEEDVCLPEVFAANWMVQFPNSMSVDAVALCCSRRSLGVVKKLLPLIPPGSFQYELIPIGFEKECGLDNFARLVGNHNVSVHKLNSIAVMYLHPAAWEMVIPGTHLTMRQQFEKSGYFHLIECTESTNRNGRHILVVHADKFAEAETVLTEFFRDTFRTMATTKYLDAYQQWPHLQFGSARRSTGPERVNAIMECVHQHEQILAGPGGALLAKTARPAPSMFDLLAVQASESAATATPQDLNDAASVSTHATTNTYAATVKSSKPSLRIVTPANDETSIAGRSAGKSVYSEAMSTVLTNFESVLTKQSEQISAMLEQQAESHRQQTAFQMKQAEVQARQTDMMLQMMSTILKHLPSVAPLPSAPVPAPPVASVPPAPPVPPVPVVLAPAPAVAAPPSAAAALPVTPQKAPPGEACKRQLHPVQSPIRPAPNAPSTPSATTRSPSRDSQDETMVDAHPATPIPPPRAAPDPRVDRSQQ